MTYKIVDLFAGPGGLGEGFASFEAGSKFKISISAEMESSAHSTLTLRSFYRHIQGDEKALSTYLDFCTQQTAPHPSQKAPQAWKSAVAEAHRLELGTSADNRVLDELISKAKLSQDKTVLIGGPPCQAYSLVGRSRNRGKENYVAEEDHRHFLYKEYLRILSNVRPAVFVMENVKGILSSRVNGELVFHDILKDLAEPGRALKKKSGLKYTVHSLVSRVKFEAGMDPTSIDVNEFVIQAEKYGIPQSRHRVILLGVRDDLAYDGHHLLNECEEISVWDAIGDLPPLRSKLSREDSNRKWTATAKDLARKLAADAKTKGYGELARALREEAKKLGEVVETGSIRFPSSMPAFKESTYDRWVRTPGLNVWLNHESRSHMPSDLGRYFYTAVFGQEFGRTPKSHRDFPLEGLAPAHKNWESGKFIDRFRVQRREEPSTTVTSHIAKDGHYFIHPDPRQCRSLTVREAARLQTFPDNYFFQGNRTQQYQQVGNAVPSLLATQIARIVSAVLEGQKRKR